MPLPAGIPVVASRKACPIFFSRSLSLRSPMVMSVSHISGRKGTGREGGAEVTPTDRPLVAVRSISPGRPHRTNESITDRDPGDPHTTQMGVVGDLDLDVRGPPRRPSSCHRMKPLSLLRHGHGDGRPPDWASREKFLSRLSSHVSRLFRIPHDPHPPSPTLDQTGLFTEAHHHPTSTETPPFLVEVEVGMEETGSSLMPHTALVDRSSATIIVGCMQPPAVAPPHHITSTTYMTTWNAWHGGGLFFFFFFVFFWNHNTTK